MGKETKIGLGVIAVLFIVLMVVLTLRLTGPRDDTVASTETAEPASDSSSGNSAAKAAPAPKPLTTRVVAKKQTFATNSNLSDKLAPLPQPLLSTGGEPRRSAGWANAGGQSSPTQSGSSMFVLDPPKSPRSNDGSATTGQQNPLGIPSPQKYSRQRYDRQRASAGMQTPSYRSRASQQVHQNVSATRSTVGTSNYDGYQQNKRGYQRNYGNQSRYNSQYAVTPPPATPQSITAGPRADGRYEVQPNDSYWQISKRVYGNGAYFKALAEHNLKDHPVADRLRVGDAISTPSLAELVDDYPDFCPSPERRKTLEKRSRVAAVSSQYAGGSTYAVQNGDTLYDIARYELGDASRWVEIYELNRNVIQGDFDYLTPGMKLVMPREAADSITPDSITQRPALYQSPSQNTLRR